MGLYFGSSNYLASLWVNEFKDKYSHTVEDKTKDVVTQVELVDLKEDLKQIVEQSPTSINDEIPERADFLSKNNQKVKIQTRARRTGRFHNASKSGSPAQQVSKKTVARKKADLGLSGLAIDEISKPHGYGGTGATVSQTEDHLKDIEKGAHTLLNTKKFLHYSYFMRIKEQVRSHWHPKIRSNVKMLFSQGRAPTSFNDKSTSLRVTLKANGALDKLELLKTSGVPAIDHAAVTAFQAAAPFTNPPSALKESDGKIRFMWDFILEG